MTHRISLLTNSPTITEHMNTDENVRILESTSRLIWELSLLCSAQSSTEVCGDIVKEYVLSFIRNAPVKTAFLDLNHRFLATSSSWDAWFMTCMIRNKNKIHSLKGYKLNPLSSFFPLRILKSLKNLQQNKPVKFDLFEIKIANGQTRWIKLEAFPWGAGQQTTGLILFCHDITEQQELLLDNQKLHHTNEMLQNFSLILSHDLIRPLRQISNHVYLIEDQLRALESIASSSLENILSPIKKCITHAQELCEGITFYCRNGGHTVKTEPICLRDILQDITENCLQNVNVGFKYLITQDLYLLANKIALFQLFQNLLDNAIKHSHQNIPTITLHAKKLKNGFCKFDLYSNSYCSNSKNLYQIFNAFESSKDDGSGLGLMICKKIVSAYGGMIFIKSSLKKGTTVTFTLPFCDRHGLADERYQPNKTMFDGFDRKILETKKTCE